MMYRDPLLMGGTRIYHGDCREILTAPRPKPLPAIGYDVTMPAPPVTDIQDDSVPF